MSNTEIVDYEAEMDEAVKAARIADETTEAETEVSEGAEDTPTTVETATEASTRPKPAYGLLDVADDLPEQDSGRRGGNGGGPSMVLHNLLVEIQGDPDLHDKWVKVVTYTTPNGAKLAVRDIESGKRVVPEGDFDYEVRRVTDEATGKRVSALWVRYNT